MKVLRVVVVALLTVGPFAVAPAQTAFEAASVRLSPPRTGTDRFVSMDTSAGMVRYSNISLRLMISIAYKVDTQFIEDGAGFVDDQKYDVGAKLPAGSSKDQVPAMLLGLLKERFGLVVHRAWREQRVYLLNVGKGGAKLKVAQTPEPAAEDAPKVDQVRGTKLPVTVGRGVIAARGVPVGALAGALSTVLHGPVEDHTGIAGSFDVDLRWTPDDAASTSGPSLFTAVQEQLGLRLDTGKGSVEMLVVDHVERVPTEN